MTGLLSTATLLALAKAEYTHIAAAVVAGYAATKAWFSKEIAAGKAALVKVESTVKADASKVEAKVKAEVDKVL